MTEDLDLSYRAQLAGWRFVFLPDVTAPAELPADLDAFKGQQHRWARGSIQTARKLLPRLLAAPLPWRTRLEALVHLTSNASYSLMLVLALLVFPAMLLRRGVGLSRLAPMSARSCSSRTDGAAVRAGGAPAASPANRRGILQRKVDLERQGVPGADRRLGIDADGERIGPQLVEPGEAASLRGALGRQDGNAARPVGRQQLARPQQVPHQLDVELVARGSG